MRAAPIIASLLVVVGCRADNEPAAAAPARLVAPSPAPSPAPAASPSAPRPRRPSDDLADKADKMLAASVAPDYRQPMADARPARKAVRRAYLDACLAGDMRSCWMTREVEVEIGNEELGRRHGGQLVENCRAGDRLSCSAMEAEDMQDIDMLPGHGARSHCTSLDCDLRVLARECRDGYADSCVKLREGQSVNADRAEVTASARRLTLEGCRAGILRDCRSAAMLFSDESKPEDREPRLVAYQQLCTLGLRCIQLARAYLPDDPEKARTAYEIGCQHRAACEELWHAYTATPAVLAEPVPGRAATLRDYVCKTYKDCWQ